MWVTVINTKKQFTADAWREMFQAEGVPVKVFPVDNAAESESANFQVMVPVGRQHVVNEILKHI